MSSLSLAALLFHSGIVVFQSWFSELDSSRYIGLSFIAAIVIVFLWAVVSLLRYRRSLPAQHEALDQVRWNYERLLPTQEKNPDVIKGQLLKGVDEDTAAAQRVIKLHSIRSQGGDFEQAPLAEVVAAQEAAKISFAKYVASILVLLGLCGAIMGLSNLVFQMGPELRTMQELNRRSARSINSPNTSAAGQPAQDPLDQSIDGLIETMAKSLAHTWSAFLASLLGILTSIALLAFNLNTSRLQVKFLSELEDLTATKLIPILRPPRELAELSGAVEAFKEASTYISALSSDLEKTSTGVVQSMRDFDDIVYKFRAGTETLQQGEEKIHEAQQTMLDVAKEFGETSKSIANHLSHSRTTFDGVAKTIGDSDKKLNTVIDEWRKNHEAVLQLIQTVSTNAEKRSTEARAEIEKAVSELNQLIKNNFKEQLEGLTSACLAAFDKQDELDQRLIREMGAEFKTSLEDLRNGLKELQVSANGDGQRELITRIDGFIGDERSHFTQLLDEKLKQERDMFGQRLQELMGAVREPRLYEVLDDIRNLNKDLKSYLRAQQPGPIVSTTSNDAKLQQDLVAHVGSLTQSFNWLNSMLRIVVGLLGFTLPVVGLLALTRKFDLWWLANWMGHELYVAAIVVIGVFVSWLLVRLSRPGETPQTRTEQWR